MRKPPSSGSTPLSTMVAHASGFATTVRVAHPSRGSGLIGLTDRVEALGGTMTIVSPRHSGTTVEVKLPLTALAQG